MCEIEQQIAKHCDEQEVLCPKCGSQMYIELCETTLKCSECEHEIEPSEE